MTGKELVWRAILVGRRVQGRTHWQQKELGGLLGMSVSTVNAGLRVPRRAGAIRVGARGLDLVDWRKLLLIWAVFRNLEKDRVWETRLRLPVSEVEGIMVPDARFSGPSGFKFLYDFVPADYDEVVVYLEPEKLTELKRRYAEHIARRGGDTLLTVLAPDALLPPEVPPEQIYVDLWQMHPWWTVEFIRSLEERLEEGIRVS